MRGTRNTFIDYGKSNRQNIRESNSNFHGPGFSNNRQFTSNKAQEQKIAKFIVETLMKNSY
jgi:hypothetical protein